MTPTVTTWRNASSAKTEWFNCDKLRWQRRKHAHIRTPSHTSIGQMLRESCSFLDSVDARTHARYKDVTKKYNIFWNNTRVLTSQGHYRYVTPVASSVFSLKCSTWAAGRRIIKMNVNIGSPHKQTCLHKRISTLLLRTHTQLYTSCTRRLFCWCQTAEHSKAYLTFNILYNTFIAQTRHNLLRSS